MRQNRGHCACSLRVPSTRVRWLTPLGCQCANAPFALPVAAKRAQKTCEVQVPHEGIAEQQIEQQVPPVKCEFPMKGSQSSKLKSKFPMRRRSKVKVRAAIILSTRTGLPLYCAMHWTLFTGVPRKLPSEGGRCCYFSFYRFFLASLHIGCP